MSTREQASIIDAAVAAGVKRFIPSEYGNDTSITEVAILVPSAQGKQETIKYLRTKESSGLSWTAICVGAFFDWTFQRPALLGWNLPARKAVIIDGETGEDFYASISFGVIVAAIYGHAGFNNFSKTRGLWNKKLGLPEEDLEGSLVQILRESGGYYVLWMCWKPVLVDIFLL
jgi:hypothetical protein